MSLNAHDRQALARIEEELEDADPQFAANLSAFWRLADGEAMPEREEIHGTRRPVIVPALCVRRPGRPRARLLVYAIAIAMAVSITLAVISVALVTGRGGGKDACPQWGAIACVKQTMPSAPAPSGHNTHAPSLLP